MFGQNTIDRLNKAQAGACRGGVIAVQALFEGFAGQLYGPVSKLTLQRMRGHLDRLSECMATLEAIDKAHENQNAREVLAPNCLSVDIVHYNTRLIVSGTLYEDEFHISSIRTPGSLENIFDLLEPVMELSDIERLAFRKAKEITQTTPSADLVRPDRYEEEAA